MFGIGLGILSVEFQSFDNYVKFHSLTPYRILMKATQ